MELAISVTVAEGKRTCLGVGNAWITCLSY